MWLMGTVPPPQKIDFVSYLYTKSDMIPSTVRNECSDYTEYIFYTKIMMPSHHCCILILF